MKKRQKKSWAWRSLYIWYRIMLIYINFKFNFLTKYHILNCQRIRMFFSSRRFTYNNTSLNIDFFLTKHWFFLQKLLFFRENVYRFILVKPEFKWVMHVGNCTALSMVSSQMVKCHRTKPCVVVMTHSTHSSVKLARENMYQELFLLTLNQLLLVCMTYAFMIS